jgi:hypothetical protein
MMWEAAARKTRSQGREIHMGHALPSPSTTRPRSGQSKRKERMAALAAGRIDPRAIVECVPRHVVDAALVRDIALEGAAIGARGAPAAQRVRPKSQAN